MSMLGSRGFALLATLASSTAAFSIEGLTSELGLSDALMEGEPRYAAYIADSDANADAIC